MRLKEKKSYLIMLGLFEAAAVLANFYSIRYTTVSIAVLLLYTTPIYVTLLSPWVLKENITRRSIIALMISVTGVVLVVQPQTLQNGINIIGVALGLVSGGILYFRGLRLIKAQSASIISLLEPVSAVVFAFLILSEPVEYTTALGGGLIFLGAFITSREGISKQG